MTRMTPPLQHMEGRTSEVTRTLGSVGSIASVPEIA